MAKLTITIDANGKTIGRVASRAAHILMGKHAASFARHKVSPTMVVIHNAAKVKLSGKKESTKTYKRFSGYPGGLKRIPYKKAKAQRPEMPLQKAISGMIPRNRLKKPRLKNLKIFAYAKDSKNN